jgi:hypothetical protein
MFVSPHLKFDPTKSLKPAAEYLCGMTAEIPPEVNVATLSAGQWWAYPLARAADDVFFGLRLTPGVSLKRSPVVVAQRALAKTIASRPAYLVPVRVHQIVLGSEARWAELAATAAKPWKELIDLHHSLGGDDDLDELRKVLKDKRLKAAHRSPDFPTKQQVRLETQARLDPTPETAAYASYVARVLSERAAPAPAPEAGCWNEALATLVLYVAQQESDDQAPRHAEEQWAARRIVSQLPGLDARTNVVTDLSEEAAIRIATSAAKIVTKAKDKTGVDPRGWAAIGKVASTKKYDGSAHLELAKTLEAAKDHPGAFVALMTAAFWQAQRKDTVDTTIHDRARKLARKARWVDIADALDEMHEVRAEMIKDGDWSGG